MGRSISAGSLLSRGAGQGKGRACAFMLVCAHMCAVCLACLWMALLYTQSSLTGDWGSASGVCPVPQAHLVSTIFGLWTLANPPPQDLPLSWPCLSRQCLWSDSSHCATSLPSHLQQLPTPRETNLLTPPKGPQGPPPIPRA